MKFVTLVLVLTVSAGCQESEHLGREKGSDEAVVATAFPGQDRLLSTNDLALAKLAAVRGDAIQAQRVAQHYFHAEPDGVEFERWTLIAAENGSVVGMTNVAGALWDGGDEFACARAIYWLESASQEAKKDGLKEIGSDVAADIHAIQEDIKSPAGKCQRTATGGYYYVRSNQSHLLRSAAAKKSN